MSSESVPVDETQLRRLHEAAAVQPRGEWFVAGREDDDEHPWWLFSFEQCAAGDECDHQECSAVPVVALCPYDDSYDTDERVAEWAAAAFNALPSLLDRLAAVEQERDQLRAEGRIVLDDALFERVRIAVYSNTGLSAASVQAASAVVAALGSGVRR